MTCCWTIYSTMCYVYCGIIYDSLINGFLSILPINSAFNWPRVNSLENTHRTILKFKWCDSLAGGNEVGWWGKESENCDRKFVVCESDWYCSISICIDFQKDFLSHLSAFRLQFSIKLEHILTIFKKINFKSH